MLNNYLRVAFRKFGREKLYSLINLAGLSIAIACCLILGLYLKSELSYDQHHLNHENIYRAATDFTTDGKVDRFSLTSPVLGLMMAADFDEIESYVGFRHLARDYYYYEDKAFVWDDTYEVSDNVFDVFTHEIIFGDPATALEDGSSVAVSQTFAERYFGNRNPVGELLTTDDNNPVRVMLVFADLPENTHLKYDLLISANHPDFAQPDDLTDQRNRLFGLGYYTYLLMKEGFDEADFPEMFSTFVDRHITAVRGEVDTEMKLSALALDEIHLNSDLLYDQPVGSKTYLLAFALAAIFILAVASINYTNLATARSTRHAKDIGMRKILGASKNTLALQLLAESTIFALLSMLVGLVLVKLCLLFTPLNQLLGVTLELNLAAQPEVLGWLLLFSLTVGLLSGAYPALYLSSWAPLSALVNNSKGSSGEGLMRKALVLAQFTISVAVIACTLLMANQMQFMSEKSLGFEKEYRITFNIVGRDQLRKTPTLRSALLENPNVLGVTTSANVLGRAGGLGIFQMENNAGMMVQSTSATRSIDYDYLDTLGMKLASGRNFSREILTDIDSSILVNQSLVEQMGWDNPLGKRLERRSDIYRVVGVVEDFNFQSLHSLVEPLIMFPYSEKALDEVPDRAASHINAYMTVSVASNDLRETLDYVALRFGEFDTKHPFEFEFLDDFLSELYQSEDSLMKLIGIFAGLCIFIACLGLFGLASFTTEQRSKEIGIRKVLGASAGQIIFLLSKSMLSLVLIGAVVGCAIAYFAIDAWLSNFAYRAEMSPMAYVGAILAALAVAYVTVASQAYKTAQSDPVDALRYE